MSLDDDFERYGTFVNDLVESKVVFVLKEVNDYFSLFALHR
jgi:hypothetical protein